MKLVCEVSLCLDLVAFLKKSSAKNLHLCNLSGVIRSECVG